LAFFCRLFGACFGDDVRDFLYVLSSSGIVGDFCRIFRNFGKMFEQ
jgi:hypothetical protein